MKTCNKCGASKVFAEFHKDAGAKDGHCGACKECAIARARAHYCSLDSDKKAQSRARAKALTEQNRDVIAQRRRKYAEEKREWLNARRRDKRLTDVEAYRAKKRAAYANSTPEQLGIARANSRRREAKKIQRTPAWANKSEIERFYVGARMARDQGIEVDVDHIYPLQGDTVSGLHVHQNLTVLSSAANRKKSNQYPDFKFINRSLDELIAELLTPRPSDFCEEDRHMLAQWERDRLHSAPV